MYVLKTLIKIIGNKNTQKFGGITKSIYMGNPMKLILF